MKKALHVFAVNGKTNSGDFFLGPATKWKFQKDMNTPISWQNFNVRKPINKKDLEYFNTFDYIVIGGGGLFLPDTNPNIVSCWQFAFPTDFYSQITSDVYVVAIGWNHFYGQDITMPNRDKSFSFPERSTIFKKNIEALIEKSTSFTMRHIGDCDEMRKIVDQHLHSKIEFKFCPVVDYVKEKYASNFKNEGTYHTFEIKDDRPQRRYLGTTIQKVYQELLIYVRYLLEKGEEIAVMSHDGSLSFANFLRRSGVPFVLLNNTVANEHLIIQNYSQVKKLYCTAGHSQMTAYALGLPFHSLISHDKLKYFLRDINSFDEDKYTYVNDNDLAKKLKDVSDA